MSHFNFSSPGRNISLLLNAAKFSLAKLQSARSRFVYCTEIIPSGFLPDLLWRRCLIRETRSRSSGGSLVECITRANLKGEATWMHEGRDCTGKLPDWHEMITEGSS